MTTRALTPLTVLAAALAFAAPSLGASSPSWLKSATAICDKYHAISNKAIPTDPTTTKELVAATATQLAIDIRQNTALAKLPRPAAHAKKIAKLFVIYGQQLDGIKKMVAALKANNMKLAQQLVVKDTAITQAARDIEGSLDLMNCSR